MARPRRTAEDLAQKLGLADELAGQGKTQREIAASLGVSVMTLHRWRHARDEPPIAHAAISRPATSRPLLMPSPRARGVAELERENDRLRRLVADLLLDSVAANERRSLSRA